MFFVLRQQQELETLDKNHEQDLEIYLNTFHPELIEAVTETMAIGGEQDSVVCQPCPPIDNACFTKYESKTSDIVNALSQAAPKKVPIEITTSDLGNVTPLLDANVQPQMLPSLGTVERQGNDLSDMPPNLLDYKFRNSNTEHTVKRLTKESKVSGAGDANSTCLKTSHSLKDPVQLMSRTKTVLPSSVAVQKHKQNVDTTTLDTADFEGNDGGEAKCEVIMTSDRGARDGKSEASISVSPSQMQSVTLNVMGLVTSGVLLNQVTGIQSRPCASLAERPSVSQQPRVSVVPISRPPRPNLASFQTATLMEQLHHLFPNFVPGGRTPSALLDGAPNSSKPSQLSLASSVHQPFTQTLEHLPSLSLCLMPQSSPVLQAHASLRPSVSISPVHTLLQHQQQQQVMSSVPSLINQPFTMPQMAAMAGAVQNIHQPMGPKSVSGTLPQPVSSADGNWASLGTGADPQCLAMALHLIQQYAQNPEHMETLLQQDPNVALMRQLIQQTPTSAALLCPVSSSCHSLLPPGPIQQQQPGLIQMPISQQGSPQQLLVQQAGQQFVKPGPGCQMMPPIVPLSSATRTQGPSSMTQPQAFPQGQLLIGQQQPQQTYQLVPQPNLQSQTSQQTQMLLLHALLSDGAFASNDGGQPASNPFAQTPGFVIPTQTASDSDGGGGQLKHVQVPLSGPSAQVNLDDPVLQKLLSQKAAIENYLAQHYSSQPSFM